jgi:hypothetical protein
MGLYLKEYTACELSDLFRKVGFSRTEVYPAGARRHVRPPLLLVRVLEKMFAAIPYRLRGRIADRPRITGLFGGRLIGRK